MQNLTTVIEFQVINKYIAQHETMNVKDIVRLDQGIIDSTGKETCAKEPNLTRLSSRTIKSGKFNVLSALMRYKF